MIRCDGQFIQMPSWYNGILLERFGLGVEAPSAGIRVGHYVVLYLDSEVGQLVDGIGTDYHQLLGRRVDKG